MSQQQQSPDNHDDNKVPEKHIELYDETVKERADRQDVHCNKEQASYLQQDVKKTKHPELQSFSSGGR